MLQFLDILMTFIHLCVILFNLFGWLWKGTRKLHLWFLLLTLVSWLLLGIKYGLGYCFLTDWQWEIKRKLGETDLPNSFIQYQFNEIGLGISSNTTDWITVIALAIAVGLSLYVNFFKDRSEDHKTLN